MAMSNNQRVDFLGFGGVNVHVDTIYIYIYIHIYIYHQVCYVKRRDQETPKKPLLLTMEDWDST